MREVCATRDARLVGWTRVCFVVGFPATAGVADLDRAGPDPEVVVVGVAVDCVTPDRTTVSNPNTTTKRPRRKRRNGEEKPDIIPLYADLDATGAAGESVT